MVWSTGVRNYPSIEEANAERGLWEKNEWTGSASSGGDNCGKRDSSFRAQTFVTSVVLCGYAIPASGGHLCYL